LRVPRLELRRQVASVLAEDVIDHRNRVERQRYLSVTRFSEGAERRRHGSLRYPRSRPHL
jgi:hypothetical protein